MFGEKVGGAKGPTFGEVAENIIENEDAGIAQ
jgi:hypothetical protein